MLHLLGYCNLVPRASPYKMTAQAEALGTILALLMMPRFLSVKVCNILWSTNRLLL